MKDESLIMNKMQLTQIALSICTFECDIQISSNKKLKNLINDTTLKAKIKQYLSDFSLENYSLHFIPESKNNDEVVSEWYSSALKNKESPTILIKSKSKSDLIVGTAHISVILDSNKLVIQNICNEIKNNSDLVLKNSLLEFKEESAQELREMKTLHEQLKKDIVQEMKTEHKKEIEEIKNTFKKQAAATKNIHKLANFVGIFRRNIIKYFNDNGKNYSDWDEMKKKEKNESINQAVVHFGMDLETWNSLKGLSSDLNNMKHETIDLNQALKYTESLTDTEYGDYIEPLKKLIGFFINKKLEIIE